MNSAAELSFTEPITEPEVLAGIEALPTEDELPYDDGEPMETPRHRQQMQLLIDSLQTYWTDRTTYYVGGNMFLHYDPQSRRKFRGPDFFLVLDVEERERKSWVVWQEGMRFPDIIIELLSDSTRDVDKGEKKTLYERVFRTGEYYLYDPFSQEFLGYHLRDTHYTQVTPDEEGRIYSPTTRLYLRVQGEWLRGMTPDGKLLPTPTELAEQERQRADHAHQRADHAQQQVDQERQRAEQERQRADQAHQRADHAQQQAGEERQRAEQERQRAQHAEQLLEEYQRRFGTLE